SRTRAPACANSRPWRASPATAARPITPRPKPPDPGVVALFPLVLAEAGQTPSRLQRRPPRTPRAAPPDRVPAPALGAVRAVRAGRGAAPPVARVAGRPQATRRTARPQL